MARGDLLFYRSTGTWYERLIVAATDPGDFVHVGIHGGGNTVLEATTSGIGWNTFDTHRLLAGTIVLAPVLQHSAPEDADQAWAYADTTLGYRYGWIDIFDQVLRVLAGDRLPFYLGRMHSLDCSDLAACFAALSMGDAKLMNMVLDRRQEISPNDLARYLHVA